MSQELNWFLSLVGVRGTKEGKGKSNPIKENAAQVKGKTALESFINHLKADSMG